MNAMMVAADLFDQGKALGYQSWLEVKYHEDVHLNLERAFKIVDAVAKAKIDKLIVSLVYLISVESDETLIWNKGKMPPYWNKDVRIVSTGREWFMLDDFVRFLGFQPITDNHRYITAIT